MTSTADHCTTILHTPAPWNFDMEFIIAPDPQRRHPDIYIAEIVHSDDEGRLASPAQQDANRHLIAAAPKLLAALIDLVGNRDIDRFGQCHCCGRDFSAENLIFCPADDCAAYLARAAIAQATIAAATSDRGFA